MKKKWNKELHLRKVIMEEKFSIEMNKDEMLRYYENKIVEDGIKSCSEFNTIVNLTDYNTKEIKLEKYKNEILQLLYRDERVADVVIDDEFNVDMVFYTDYCPFYYDDEKNIIYNQIMDSPTYQGIELAEFVGYMGKRVIEDSYRQAYAQKSAHRLFRRAVFPDLCTAVPGFCCSSGQLDRQGHDRWLCMAVHPRRSVCRCAVLRHHSAYHYLWHQGLVCRRAAESGSSGS